MKVPPIDLSILQQLAGVPDLIKEVRAAFAHAPAVLSDPRFLLSLVKGGIDVAAAPDDETRREVIQIQVARITREFA